MVDQPEPTDPPILRFAVKIDIAGQVNYDKINEKSGRQILDDWGKPYLAEVYGPDAGERASCLNFGPSYHVPSDLSSSCPQMKKEKWMDLRREIYDIRVMAQARRKIMWKIAIGNPYMGLRDKAYYWYIGPYFITGFECCLLKGW